MKSDLRLSRQTVNLLEAFIAEPGEWRYGYDLSRDTGLKSGTLYPILMRLEKRKLLETRWELIENGKPPRHMYRLTLRGRELSREAVKRMSARRAITQAAYSGVKA
jgi:PadR family transcriptional regulator